MFDTLSLQGDGRICAVAVIVRNGCIITGQRNYTRDVWKDISVWTIPGGRTEVGEIIEKTIRRETEEETGITNLVFRDYIGKVPGAKEEDVLYIFLTETTQSPELREPEKFSEWREVPLQEYIDSKEYDGFNSSARTLVARHLAAYYDLILPNRFSL